MDRKTIAFERAVCRDYRRGIPVIFLMESYGIQSRKIYKILRKNSVPTRLDKARSLESVVCRDYGDGMHVIAISKLHGVSQTTLYKILHRNNIPLRGRCKTHAWDKCDRNSEIMKDRASGMVDREIAEKHGITIQRVWFIRKRMQARGMP